MFNKKLPSPSTVDSHFRKQIIEREKLLTNSSDITKLLDQYWNDIKIRVKNYLDEYNTKFGTNIDVENFKIPICLGCDAASLTKFTEKIKKEKKSNSNNKTKEKRRRKKNKNKVFQKLIGLESDSNEENVISPHEVSEEDSQYFFSMLIQPFFWKIPCTVIHLPRSINGHFSDKEAQDILELLNIINSHPHFEAKYFAADGEKGLDEYHEMAFKQYEIYIEKLINKEISFEDFFQIVIEKVKFLPLIDMMHAEKSGRNRVMNNDIKISNNSDIINRNSLKVHLEIHGNVLDDTSTIGRMKDDYPIKLFQIKHALNEFKKK